HEALPRYKQLPGVIAVERNWTLKAFEPVKAAAAEADDGAGAASLSPNDPLFGQQWYLNKIGATNAWPSTTGSSNIVVPVLDTGINYNHEDLAANIWRNPGGDSR